MKKMLILMLICALGMAGCRNGGNVNSEDERLMVGDQLPKGIIPIVLVNGKDYHWTGLADLPKGYNVIGEISGISEESPCEELQLMAGFEATGTVYSSDQTPEVVYILMTTSWFQKSFVRFVSDDLHDNESISYQGKQYRFSYDTDICKKIEELPQDCVLIGTLKYIGSDKIPGGDLETNCAADSEGNYLSGREVYAILNDSSVLYVYEQQYTKDGAYSAWRVCSPWIE